MTGSGPHFGLAKSFFSPYIAFYLGFYPPWKTTPLFKPEKSGMLFGWAGGGWVGGAAVRREIFGTAAEGPRREEPTMKDRTLGGLGALPEEDGYDRLLAVHGH